MTVYDRIREYSKMTDGQLKDELVKTSGDKFKPEYVLTVTVPQLIRFEMCLRRYKKRYGKGV